MFLSQWIFYYTMEFIDTKWHHRQPSQQMQKNHGSGKWNGFFSIQIRFLCQKRVIRYLPSKTQTPTIAGDGGARKQQLWRWFGWKSRFWRCDIGDLYFKNLPDNFGGACFLPSFSGTSLSDHGGSRFGDTFWGAFSCPWKFQPTITTWAISGNTFIMGHFAQVQTKVVKQFLCEVLSSYHVVHALHYQKRTISTLKIRKAPMF